MSDIFTVMDMLDHMTQEEISRMKVETSDALEEGSTEKTYHHGRCDVGSPFATGKLYDLEDEEGAETNKDGGELSGEAKAAFEEIEDRRKRNQGE